MRKQRVKTLKVKKPFIVFGQPDISEEEIGAVTNVLKSGWIGTGRISRMLEEEFVKHMGGGHAVAVSSCSIGLTIALRAVGVCHGDNVLTTPLTFCATVNAILANGARPKFADVDHEGLLKEKDSRVDAILPVNYTGLSANYYSSVPVIEDAAHSFGGDCGYGDISVFSFYATKNITSAEGGMIWTKSRELADKCRLLSNNGQSSGAWSRYSSGPINNYHVVQPGFKGNLPDVLAAIGLTQIKRAKQLRSARSKVWEIYEKAFGKKPSGHSQHLYTIQVKNRPTVREELYNRGIGTGIHYEALHLEPAYKFLGYKLGDFPVAERFGFTTLSLPVSNTMTKDDAWYVVASVKEVLEKTQ